MNEKQADKIIDLLDQIATLLADLPDKLARNRDETRLAIKDAADHIAGAIEDSRL